MGVSNTVKKINKIWKNLENKKGYPNFQPNWNLVFEDGTEAKIKLSEYGHLCEKVAEGGSYLFTIEDGVTDSGKQWFAIRDILASGGMPTPLGGHKPENVPGTPPQVQKQAIVDPTMPVNGAALGMCLNNAVLIVVARLGTNDPSVLRDALSIEKDIEFWGNKFLSMVRRGEISSF